MMLPRDEQPMPPRPKPVPKPTPASRKRASGSTGEPRTKQAPRPRAARLPRHADEPSPELTGAFDLSYEVPDENVTFHVRGQESGWLAISAFPAALRSDGWVYLQVNSDVVARARVKGIGYRDTRWSQEPTATASDLGGGPTLELHEGSWERLSLWLGPEGERPTKGFRYLITEPRSTEPAAVRIAEVD